MPETLWRVHIYSLTAEAGDQCYEQSENPGMQFVDSNSRIGPETGKGMPRTMREAGDDTDDLAWQVLETVR